MADDEIIKDGYRRGASSANPFSIAFPEAGVDGTTSAGALDGYKHAT
jgi:hypothetical protein